MPMTEIVRLVIVFELSYPNKMKGSEDGIYLLQNLFFFFFIHLFIYLWLHWVFIAAYGLSLVVASGASLRCSAWVSHCSGFSCCGARALGAWASVVVAHGLSSCGLWALERRLSSCGTWA